MKGGTYHRLDGKLAVYLIFGQGGAALVEKLKQRIPRPNIGPDPASGAIWVSYEYIHIVEVLASRRGFKVCNQCSHDARACGGWKPWFASRRSELKRRHSEARGPFTGLLLAPDLDLDQTPEMGFRDGYESAWTPYGKLGFWSGHYMDEKSAAAYQQQWEKGYRVGRRSRRRGKEMANLAEEKKHVQAFGKSRRIEARRRNGTD